MIYQAQGIDQRYRMIPISLLAVLVELGIVILVALSVTTAYLNPTPDRRLTGGEAEWLTNSAYLTSMNLQTEGYIPQWQPWLNFGEPVIENPFSFVLNPFSTLPSWWLGGVIGIKVSVVLAAIIAGIGGWFLGRILNLGTVGRVLLGVLCVGKGNMMAMFATGYFQLAITQAYFPWIIGGTIAILRLRHRRWPLVLTAIAFTFMFWAGNIWYSLPLLMMMSFLSLAHVVHLKHAEGEKLFSVSFDGVLIWRMIVCGVLIGGLSAATLIPLWIHRDHIGDHPNETEAGTVADMGRVLRQFVDGDIGVYNQHQEPGQIQFYYSFIAPLWFVILYFCILPPIPPLYKPKIPQSWRIWSVALLVAFICTIWGAGGNPVFVFLYTFFPLLAQWRFVGRALAVASFALAILIAVRIDGLWQAFVVDSELWKRVIDPGKLPTTIPRGIIAIGIIITCAAAASEVNRQWTVFTGTESISTIDDVCITWLRDHNPDKQLSVYVPGYVAIDTYIRNRVRLFNVASDFRMIPDAPTLYQGDLTRSLPEYGMGWDKNLRSYFAENNYKPVLDSPKPVDDFNCLFQKTDVFSYAYSIPAAVLAPFHQPGYELIPGVTTPITSLDRRLDRIALLVDSSPYDSLVVTVQEAAYPGWGVLVDGAPAKIESVGGQIGVVLPPGNA